MRRVLLVLVGVAGAAAVAAVPVARHVPTASYDPRDPAGAAIVGALGDRLAGKALRVRVAQTDSWWRSLLDDDPIVGAEVELEAAGPGAPRVVRLWAFGRLTPGGLQLVGDGWHADAATLPD